MSGEQRPCPAVSHRRPSAPAASAGARGCRIADWPGPGRPGLWPACSWCPAAWASRPRRRALVAAAPRRRPLPRPLRPRPCPRPAPLSSPSPRSCPCPATPSSPRPPPAPRATRKPAARSRQTHGGHGARPSDAPAAAGRQRHRATCSSTCSTTRSTASTRRCQPVPELARDLPEVSKDGLHLAHPHQGRRPLPRRPEGHARGRHLLAAHGRLALLSARPRPLRRRPRPPRGEP